MDNLSDILKKPVIFCDFDGTITENDNILEIMKHFDPAGWTAIVEAIMAQRITLQEGVGSMFALFPSAMKDDVIRYVEKQLRIRAGFPELLRYCRDNGIEFLVASGGIDFFVYPALAPFDIDPSHIYCNGSDFSGERIRITWPNACGPNCEEQGCGMCKPSIIHNYAPDQYERIMIGDSISDFKAAQVAETIFARSHLAERCEELGVPFYRFESFHEVISQLDIHLTKAKAQ